MKESGVTAIASFVLAGKEKLCLIRPKGDALALETLFVKRMRREEDRRGGRPTEVKGRSSLAQQIIASLRRRSTRLRSRTRTARRSATC